jgi:hypothetical protein
MKCTRVFLLASSLVLASLLVGCKRTPAPPPPQGGTGMKIPAGMPGAGQLR